MPRETQGRILRVLVEQRFRRVGGDTDVQVDVRVVSSTSRDLREEIAAGRFREDLFHRLNVVPVRVPGLAERREDIPELVDYFIERISDGHRPAAAQAGRRRPRHPAGARLARQRAPAAQQRRADADPGLRRSRPSRSPPTCCRPRPAASRPAGGLGAERIIALPLREAREVFEREYLNAQIAALRRQHLAHRRLHRHGALGPAPQAEVAGRRPARARWRKRSADGRASPMSTAASCRTAEAAVHIEDRGYQFADAVYEVWAVFDGKLADAEGHFARLERSLGELRIAMPMSRAALTLVLRETVRRNRVARRPALSAGQPRRRARATTPFPIRPSPPGVVITVRRVDRAAGEARAAKGVGGDHRAGEPLGPLRHQDGGPAAQCPGQAGGPGGRRRRGLVRRRPGLRHRGRVVQRLDRRRRGACCAPATPTPTSCAASPARPCSRSSRARRPGGGRAAVHAGGGRGGPGSLHHRRRHPGAAGGRRWTASRWATASRARWRQRLRRLYIEQARRRRLNRRDCACRKPRLADLVCGRRLAARRQQKRRKAMSSEKKQNLQDTFLNSVRKSKTPLTIFLVNGVKLQGVVSWFDNFCVLLRRDGQSQLVYKHAISTIMPAQPVQLYEPGDEDEDELIQSHRPRARRSRARSSSIPAGTAR